MNVEDNMNGGRRLKVGVAGVGHLGRHHARILGDLPACEVVGIFDVNRGTAEKIAAEHKLPVVDSLEELIERAEALSIATPTVTHHEVAAKALERGRHVLVEKPLTPTLAEAEDLLAIAGRRGATLQVGHVERFNGAILAVRDLVVDPRFIEVHRLSPFPARSTDIGVILDVMIHDIDILLSLVRSKVARIDAIGTSIITSKEDIANARITFESGCVANVTASRISYQTLRKIRIFSPDRYISVDYHKQDAVMYRKASGVERIGSVSDIERIAPKITKTEPLRLELEAFVEACLGRGPRAATGEEGRNALEVALEIGRQISARPS
jgi:predicted dehydrogenase